MNIVALIPARGGSTRIPRKNVKVFHGKPLLVWSIEAAQASRRFSRIYVCTDDDNAAVHAEGHGAMVIRRPRSSVTEPDIVWVTQALAQPMAADAFAILRPTSPFRTAETIQRAVTRFTKIRCSSLRAVEPARQHPGKMWTVIGNRMNPYDDGDCSDDAGDVPWHSRPTQCLPRVFVQNASLEIAWRWCVDVFDSISGPKVAPFFTEGYEGFDLNTEDDWQYAEWLVASGKVQMPTYETSVA